MQNKSKEKNSKLKRALPAGLMAGLCLLSVGAWLTTNQTSTTVNSIKPGQVSIKFENEQNAITLQGAMPMTDTYSDEKQTPYTFNIANKGDIDLNYKIYAAQVDGQLDTVGNMRMKTDNVNETGDEAYKDMLKLGVISPDGELQVEEDTTVLAEGQVLAGEADNFTFNMHLAEGVKYEVPSIQGQSATYKLFVIAEQVGAEATNPEGPTDPQGPTNPEVDTYNISGNMYDGRGHGYNVDGLFTPVFVGEQAYRIADIFNSKWQNDKDGVWIVKESTNLKNARVENGTLYGAAETADQPVTFTLERNDGATYSSSSHYASFFAINYDVRPDMVHASESAKMEYKPYAYTTAYDSENQRYLALPVVDIQIDGVTDHASTNHMLLSLDIICKDGTFNTIYSSTQVSFDYNERGEGRVRLSAGIPETGNFELVLKNAKGEVLKTIAVDNSSMTKDPMFVFTMPSGMNGVNQDITNNTENVRLATLSIGSYHDGKEEQYIFSAKDVEVASNSENLTNVVVKDGTGDWGQKVIEVYANVGEAGEATFTLQKVGDASATYTIPYLTVK